MGQYFVKEEEFKRLPTEEEEVGIGKREGIRGLFEIIRKRYNKKLQGTEDEHTSKLLQEKAKKKRPDIESRDSDEESAKTSSDEEEEDVSYKESPDSSSSELEDSSIEGSADSDREAEGNFQYSEHEQDEHTKDTNGSSSQAATSDHDE